MTTLEFINFSIVCVGIRSMVEIVDDQPTTLYRARLVKKYVLMSYKDPITELHDIKFVIPTLRNFHSQLQEYFGNLKTEGLIPRFAIQADDVGVSSQSPLTYLNGHIMSDVSQVDTSTDDKIVEYLNSLFAVERILFCPFVRQFFKLDSGRRNENEGSFSDMTSQQTLEARRCFSFWQQATEAGEH